jgi:hypothetical protein
VIGWRTGRNERALGQEVVYAPWHRRLLIMSKVARTGISRDTTRLYYIKGGAVWSSPRKGIRGKPEKVASFDAVLDYTRFLYFVDGDGDVARKPRKNAK